MQNVQSVLLLEAWSEPLHANTTSMKDRMHISRHWWEPAVKRCIQGRMLNFYIDWSHVSQLFASRQKRQFASSDFQCGSSTTEINSEKGQDSEDRVSFEHIISPAADLTHQGTPENIFFQSVCLSSGWIFVYMYVHDAGVQEDQDFGSTSDAYWSYKKTFAPAMDQYDLKMISDVTLTVWNLIVHR